MTEASDLTRAVEILTEDDPPRVWSLLVTIFGDLAQGDGDGLSGRVLARMAEVAGLRPETVRVALHRLRKDGWVDSHRNGRRSRYTLTDYGRAQSAAAALRIYAAQAPEPAGWTILIADPNGSDDGLAEIASHRDAVALGVFCLLVPGHVAVNDQSLLSVRADAAHIPNWVRNATCTDELRQAYESLITRLGRIDGLVATDAPILEMMTLRALVVHSWRRVLLRHGDLPVSLYPDDWPGEACRTAVMALLARLPRPSLALLESAAAEDRRSTDADTL